jgi:hypothetical protein
LIARAWICASHCSNTLSSRLSKSLESLELYPEWVPNDDKSDSFNMKDGKEMEEGEEGDEDDLDTSELD